jgi:hypothetical protein
MVHTLGNQAIMCKRWKAGAGSGSETIITALMVWSDAAVFQLVGVGGGGGGGALLVYQAVAKLPSWTSAAANLLLALIIWIFWHNICKFCTSHTQYMDAILTQPSEVWAPCSPSSNRDLSALLPLHLFGLTRVRYIIYSRSSRTQPRSLISKSLRHRCLGETVLVQADVPMALRKFACRARGTGLDSRRRRISLGCYMQSM